MARNPRDDNVMSNESSSDVDSDMSSSSEQITLDDGIYQRDTNHIACAVSQRDNNYQLNGACDGTISLGAILSLISLLELEELSSMSLISH